jgi:hypothetical protein
MCPFQRLPAQRKSNRLKKSAVLFAAYLFGILFPGCAFTPDQPNNINNICQIFRENPEWYTSARSSYDRWGITIPVIMAIMYQESSFISDAKPPRTTCLWIFPGPRPSSAYGYAQASDATWEQYCRSTGNTWADRDNFEEAIDFIGWYCDVSSKRCLISKKDVYNLYLAYHEGHGGFNRKTYQKKEWLMGVARQVQKRANTYKSQLASCEKEFIKTGFCLWPF